LATSSETREGKDYKLTTNQPAGERKKTNKKTMSSNLLEENASEEETIITHANVRNAPGPETGESSPKRDSKNLEGGPPTEDEQKTKKQREEKYNIGGSRKITYRDILLLLKKLGYIL